VVDADAGQTVSLMNDAVFTSLSIYQSIACMTAMTAPSHTGTRSTPPMYA
jgi:hypothetical protein